MTDSLFPFCTGVLIYYLHCRLSTLWKISQRRDPARSCEESSARSYPGRKVSWVTSPHCQTQVWWSISSKWCMRRELSIKTLQKVLMQLMLYIECRRKAKWSTSIIMQCWSWIWIWIIASDLPLYIYDDVVFPSSLPGVSIFWCFWRTELNWSPAFTFTL